MMSNYGYKKKNQSRSYLNHLVSCDAHLLNELLETDVLWDDAIVVSAVKLRKPWDSLNELRSSLRERRLEKTVLRPAPLPIKTAEFTQFFPQIYRRTVISFSLTFRHRASCIWDGHFTTLQRTLFIYLINKYISVYDICLTVHL